MKPPKESSDSAYQMEWWGRQGIVYFFGVGTPLLAIKIGVTSVGAGQTLPSAIRHRFKAIQTSNHEPVELLGIIRFSSGELPTRLAEVLERELHIKFAELQRFAPHTCGAEWFTASPALAAYIQESATAPEALGLARTIAFPIKRLDGGLISN